MNITRTLAGGALLATILSTSVFAQERTLQLGHLANEDNSWHLAAVKFGEELSALTDGRIAVEVFPNESLGKEIDLINGMQLGTVDMTITGESLQKLGADGGTPGRSLWLQVNRAHGRSRFR